MLLDGNVLAILGEGVRGGELIVGLSEGEEVGHD